MLRRYSLTTALTLLLLLAAFPARGDEEGEGRPFEELFRLFQDPAARAPEPVRHKGGGIHYVFVTGFTGDIVPLYWGPQIAELKTLGVPSERIHVIRPSSGNPVDRNSDWLKDQLRKIPGKLVVVGHSKGAVESLAFAVKHPEFVEKRVERMYLIQGPFQGSPLADLVVAPKPEVDLSGMNFWDRLYLRGSLFAGRSTYRQLFYDGLASLTTDATRDFWGELRKRHGDSLPLVSPKVRFLTTAFEGGAVTRYLDRVAGPSDGVVPLRSQSLGEWGDVAARLDAFHTETVFPLPGGGPKRQSLMRAIYAEVETADDPGRCPWNRLHSGK